MGVSLDRKNYEDCYDLFDRALASDWGVQRIFETQSEAFSYRSRLNKARQLDRELNKRIHADNPDHPEYGQSYYSAIIIRIRYDDDRDRWLCRLEKLTAHESLIEEIPPPVGMEQVEEIGEGAE